ncbi:MAG: response regulator transcription factor [Thermodesulfobacteriota bacterium]
MSNDKFRILIVDDNGPFRELLKGKLQSFSPAIAIDVAANGDEALRKVDVFLPNLIFMDIRLPGENGLDLTKKIRATRQNVIVFIITFYDTPEYRNRAFQCGAQRFIAKTSWDWIGLKELVKRYLQVETGKRLTG